MVNEKLSKGKLLVAEPSILGDSSFNRSIIFLTEHNDEGSIGFILNKPTTYVLNDFVPETNSSIKIYYGGPVSENNLYFVHKIPELIPESIEITNGIYWGGKFESVLELLKDDLLSPNDIRFFLGYSGWSINQLNEELISDSWILTENKHQNLFKINHHNFWKNEMNKFGGVYKIWANAPEDPSFN